MLLYQGIWRKIHFRTSLINFAWWCEVENPSAALSSCWSVSHDCVKISHGHAKSLFTFPLYVAAKPILFHFAWSCEIEKHVFSTPLCNFSHFFIFNLPLPPSIQLQIPIQIDCIASFIMHLDHHQLYLFSSIWFIFFVTNLSKSYLEMTPKLHKTC